MSRPFPLRPLLLSFAWSIAMPVLAAPASAPANVNLKLRDTPWTLETLADTPAPEGQRVHLVLASTSQHLSGNAGCNRLSGRYTQRGTALALKPVATTRMACAPAQMQLEERFLQTIAATDSYRIEGRTLSLLQGDVVKATFRALEKR